MRVVLKNGRVVRGKPVEIHMAITWKGRPCIVLQRFRKKTIVMIDEIATIRGAK